MRNTAIKYVLAVVIATSLPSSAYSACFPSISLGEYGLGEWSNADRSWVISATVGDYNDRVESKADLAKQRNKLVESCETKGNDLIKKAEDYFEAKRDNLASDYDDNCEEGDLCEDETIRDLWIASETDAINDHIEEMKAWYKNNISSCKSHFKGVYNELVDKLCN